jgi:EmrB/QacA subfamily drug resistance transporter
MQRSPAGPHAPAGRRHKGAEARRWLVLATVVLGNMMAALDTFIVNVAIPSIRHDLHASPGDAELVVTIYALVYAALLITGGRLGDIFGRARTYIIGMAVFTAASTISGAAPNSAVLIAARALQAAGAALMVPQCYAVVQQAFPPAERVRAIAALTMGGSLGVIFAQLLGGSLIGLDVLGMGWRIVFYVNVPLGVLGIVTAAWWLPRTRPGRSVSLDLPSVAMVTAALLLLVVPLAEGRDLGWPAWLLAMMGASVLVGAAAVRYQHVQAGRGRVPLFDLSLFRARTYAVGAALAALNQITNAGLFFILAVYLQTGRGLSPAMAGLAFAPLGVGYTMVAPFASRLYHRYGRAIIATGYLAVAVAIASAIVVLSVAGPSGPAFDIVPSIFAIGAGQAFVNSPLYATALSSVPQGQEGAAAGVISTFQQTGASIGVAVEGLVFFSTLGAAAGAVHVGAALGGAALRNALWLNVVVDLVGVAVVVRFLPSWRPTHAVADDPALAGDPGGPAPGPAGSVPAALAPAAGGASGKDRD